MFEQILVAVDGSAQGDRALSIAGEMARRFETAEITIVTVIPTRASVYPAPYMMPSFSQEDIDYFHKIVGERATRLRALGLRKVSTKVLEGYVAESILDFADEQHNDLIILGARGLSAAGRLLLGSTSEGVLHHAKVPVLVVRLPTPQIENRAPIAA